MQAQEAVAQDVAQMRFILYGDSERPPNQDTVNQLYDAVQSADVLGSLVLHLVHYDFEVRVQLLPIARAHIASRRRR